MKVQKLFARGGYKFNESQRANCYFVSLLVFLDPSSSLFLFFLLRIILARIRNWLTKPINPATQASVKKGKQMAFLQKKNGIESDPHKRSKKT